MLKLDPEDSDADMDEDRPDKSSNQTSPVKGGQAQQPPPPQPIMPQVDFESALDNIGGSMVPVVNAMSQNIPTNLNNLSSFVVQNQYNNNNSGATTTTPARGRGTSRGTPKKQTTAKKGTSGAAGKKKKRRISSSEEESDYNSDSDY